jgi:DNA polymerase-1
MNNSNGKKLFLLDAYALIYRGYYAFIRNPRINSKGMNTSAIYGFVNTLLDILRRENPELLAVVFDKGGSQMREQMFEAYKANRLEQPEAIEIAIPYIKKILEALHIPVLEKEGWEADDLIGTLAKKRRKKDTKFLWLHRIKISGKLLRTVLRYTVRQVREADMKFGMSTKSKKNSVSKTQAK